MITVYTSQDLRLESELKTLEEVEFSDFVFSTEPARNAEMVVYYDNDGRYKVMKIRYPISDPRSQNLLALVGIKALP